MSKIIFRGPQPGDIPFLTNSWLRSYKGSPAVRGMDNDLFYHFHHKVLETLLTRSSVVIVSYDDDPSFIMAWACVEVYDKSLIVHYMYTKKPFRKQGLAKKILAQLRETEGPDSVFYTHKTKDLFPLEDKLNDQGIYFHPYMLWVTLPEGWEQ